MDINQIKAEGLKRFFEANIAKADIIKKEAEELEKIAKKVDLKGFRKGKAPLDIIKKNYGQSVLVKTFESLTKDLLLKIYQEHKITPVTEPKVNITKGDLMQKEDLSLSLEFEVYPEVPAIDLKNITLNKTNLEIDEADIKDFLDKLSQHYFDYKDSEENRALRMGDVASINFVGKMDGKEFEGGAANNFNLELGSKAFIEGFEEQLVGAKPGDQVTVTVTFPSDYKFKQEFSNKVAEFTVKVNGLKQKVGVAVDDLPKKLGIASLDELKKDIKARHLSQYEMVLKRDLKNQLIAAIIETVDFELPSSLLQREQSAMKEDFAKYKRLKASGSKEPNAAYDSKTEEEIVKEQQELAQKKVKLSLIFNHIADSNNIYVLPEEVEQFIKQEAAKYGAKEQEVINSYKNNQNIINNIRSIILEDKILSFIFANVKYSEKNMTLAEYNKSLEEENKIGSKKA